MAAHSLPYTINDMVLGAEKLRVAEFGNEQGIPVFGFHGTPSNYLQFSTMTTAARELGIRLIVPDRPGFGDSSYFNGLTLGRWPALVNTLADNLGVSRYGVIGIASGGVYALACAATTTADERLLGTSIVNCLAPFRNVSELDGMQPSELLIMRLSLEKPWLARLLLDLSRRIIMLAGQSGVERFGKGLPKPDQALFSDQAFREQLISLNKRNKSASKASVRDFSFISTAWGFNLRSIGTKVDVFQGAQDLNTPKQHGKMLDAMLPNSLLHLYEAHGHVSIMEEAHEILRAAATDD